MKKIFLTLLALLSLAGCATSTRYLPYTDQREPAKPKYYFITVYFGNQQPPSSAPYRVIGRVEIQGYASDGVNTDMLVEQAKNIAREKGADAIINANTQVVPYGGTYVVPGHFGYYYYHPTRYIPYGDTFLKFTGELIVFTLTSAMK